MPVTFPILRAVIKTKFPKWESLKNKSGKSGIFSSLKTDRQLTSFHQQSTTTSPPKNHVPPPVFAKTPSKNAVPPPLKKIRKKASRFEVENLGRPNPRKLSDYGEWSKDVPKSLVTKFLRRMQLRLRF
jgi:hypothetical protein